MRNLALVWVLAGVALLSASLYVYSENINSADADYCLDSRASPRLLLVKKYIDLKIQTGEKPILCESYYSGFGVLAEIDFIDTSGKNIIRTSGVTDIGHILSCSDCGSSIRSVSYPLPYEIQIDLPDDMYMKIFKMSPKEQENMLNDLLQFNDKVIDGSITVFPYCKPHKLEYKIKFRARITGECDCDLIKEEEE